MSRSNHIAGGMMCGMGLLFAACGQAADGFYEGEALDDYDDALGGLEQPIYRGTQVTQNIAPYNSVVELISDGEVCTALKLSSTRFLTAAHCINSTGPGDVVDINNALNAGLAASPVDVTTVFIHPSYVSDPTAQNGGSQFSYDVALIDTPANQTASIPVANAPYTLHIPDGNIGQIGPDGGSGLFVGYGCNPITPVLQNDKQSAHFTAASQAAYGATAALYAHEILAIETGPAREGTCSGDSGGPLFRYTAAGGYQVVGVSSTGVNNVAGAQTVRSGFARVANVSRWLASPHNNSTSFNGIGFLQNRNARQCANVPNRNVGTQARLAECEGYDPDIHADLWELQPVSGTAFFRIRLARSGANRCLAVPAGTNVVSMQLCTSGQEQQWSRVQISAGDALHYKVQNRARQQFLTPGASGLVIANASATNADHWLFYR